MHGLDCFIERKPPVNAKLLRATFCKITKLKQPKNANNFDQLVIDINMAYKKHWLRTKFVEYNRNAANAQNTNFQDLFLTKNDLDMLDCFQLNPNEARNHN